MFKIYIYIIIKSQNTLNKILLRNSLKKKILRILLKFSFLFFSELFMQVQFILHNFTFNNLNIFIWIWIYIIFGYVLFYILPYQIRR
jgi:hypothetical protein